MTQDSLKGGLCEYLKITHGTPGKQSGSLMQWCMPSRSRGKNNLRTWWEHKDSSMRIKRNNTTIPHSACGTHKCGNICKERTNKNLAPHSTSDAVMWECGDSTIRSKRNNTTFFPSHAKCGNTNRGRCSVPGYVVLIINKNIT
jgi:hypothetical protein